MIPMVFPSSVNAHGDDGYPGNAGEYDGASRVCAYEYVFAPTTRIRRDADDARRDCADAHVPWLRERARGHVSPSSVATHQLA